MPTPYQRAVGYRAARSPIGRLSRGIGFGQNWEHEHPELGWQLRCGDMTTRFDPEHVRERQQAEATCRRMADQHTSHAILLARKARRALAMARQRDDALAALAALDEAHACLQAAAVHKGKAAKLRADIAAQHWQDALARTWTPVLGRRGRHRAA